MAQAPSGAPQPDQNARAANGGGHGVAQGAFWTLMIGSIGVVYGDIGTSPLYAFKESFAHVLQDGTLATPEEVLGIVSLIFWALMIVVTLKYVVLVMQMDNKGEGGTLALMALAQRAFGRRTPFIFLLGVLGAALFYGDALITPAISVLSAVEGLEAVPGLEGRIHPFVLPISIGILVALFVVQSRGTGRVGQAESPRLV